MKPPSVSDDESIVFATIAWCISFIYYGIYASLPMLPTLWSAAASTWLAFTLWWTLRHLIFNFKRTNDDVRQEFSLDNRPHPHSDARCVLCDRPLPSIEEAQRSTQQPSYLRLVQGE